MAAVSKIIFLALLCLVHQQCTCMPQQVCTFWKGVYYPSPWRSIVFDRQSFQGTKWLLYALCTSSSYDKSCQVVRDRDEPFQGGNYTCNVGMRTTLRGSVIGEHFRVVPFGDDRAILVWLERSNIQTRLGLTSVRFSDCSTHEVRMDVDHSFDDRLVLDSLQLVTYDNTYDALYMNSRLCGNNYCKLSVDVEARTQSVPTSWFSVDRRNQIVDVKAIDTADKGAVIAIETSASGDRFSILQGNAKKLLKTYSSSGTSSVASATNNDLIATCHLSGVTLSCAQYDQSGTTINDSTNQLQDNLRLSAVHNLRGGAGLFVLLNDYTQNRVQVLRLDMRGNRVGTIDVDNFQCDQNLNTVAGNFWEKDEQYCVSLACYESDEASARKSDRGHLTATAKCFTLRNLQPVQ